MNFLTLMPTLLSKLGASSVANPKTTNTISALAVLASAWFGIDASTFASVGQAMCSVGTTLQKLPSF